MKDKNDMTEELVNLEDISLNVRYALNNNPAILFLHFSGGNLHMWEGIIPQFADQYSMIVPDMRGHGKSDKPLKGYHIDDMAKDMYLLLKKLNIEKCHIVGSSMGAEIGISLAANHPEIVLSLVCEGALCNEFGKYGLFDGTEEEIQREKEKLREELERREEKVYKTVDEYVKTEEVQLSQEGLWNEFFRAFFQNNLQQMEDGYYTYCYLNRVRNEYIERYWDVKFEEYYKMAKCPILFLVSEEEKQNPKIQNSLSLFTSFLSQYEVKTIEHSIHAYVWMQLPEQAGQVVKGFIKKYEQR